MGVIMHAHYRLTGPDGAAPDADGYGLFDNYDIGSKNQFFSVPTRFGDSERLRRMIAITDAAEILDSRGDVLATASLTSARMKAAANSTGWFTLRLTGHGLPAAGTPTTWLQPIRAHRS